jgi:hypothetical protein
MGKCSWELNYRDADIRGADVWHGPAWTSRCRPGYPTSRQPACRKALPAQLIPIFHESPLAILLGPGLASDYQFSVATTFRGLGFQECRCALVRRRQRPPRVIGFFPPGVEGVAYDGEKPGSCITAPETVEKSKSTQASFLDHVLRILGIPRQPSSEVVGSVQMR